MFSEERTGNYTFCDTAFFYLQPHDIRMCILYATVTVDARTITSQCHTAAIRAGLVAEQAANRKLTKYAELAPDYILQPVAVENLGSFDSSTSSFLSNLGNKIRTSSGEDKETSFLFQRISVLIQRFNSVLLHDSFIGIYTTEGMKKKIMIIVI